jgi:hypothetical protein
MSLGVVIKGPDGIVLAADSRVTLEAQMVGQPHPFSVNFDNAIKTLSFSKEPHNFVGAVTYGIAGIGIPPRTAHSFLPEFEISLEEKKNRLPVLEYSKQLSSFFMTQWEKAKMPKDYKGPNMTFVVGGYDEGKPYGDVFLFEIPGAPDPGERHPNMFGMTWGGQLQIASRLIHGYDPKLLNILEKELKLTKEQVQNLIPILNTNLQFPIPYDVLPLQDCVNLALLLLRTTISAQHLSVDVRGVGGDIEIAIITRTAGLKYLQKKELHGEARF